MNFLIELTQLFEAPKAWMDKEVKVVRGPHRGKIGYVNKVFSDGGKVSSLELEINAEDDPEYVDVDPSDVEELKEDLTEAKVNVGSHIVIDDQAKALKAVDKLLEAGFELDLSFSMGKYYFNFKDESLADEARKVLGGK